MTFSLVKHCRDIIGVTTEALTLNPRTRICGYLTNLYPVAAMDETFALSFDFGAY